MAEVTGVIGLQISGVPGEGSVHVSCLTEVKDSVTKQVNITDIHPARRKSYRPKLIAQKKKVCEVAQCTFCSSNSCQNCKMCLTKKKCVKRACPRPDKTMKQPILSLFPNCAALMQEEGSHQDKLDKAIADIFETDIGHDYSQTNNIDRLNNENNLENKNMAEEKSVTDDEKENSKSDPKDNENSNIEVEYNRQTMNEAAVNEDIPVCETIPTGVYKCD